MKEKCHLAPPSPTFQLIFYISNVMQTCPALLLWSNYLLPQFLTAFFGQKIC